MTKAMEEARAIARYDLDPGGFLGEPGHMVPDATGEWVSYEDHTTALSAASALTAGEREPVAFLIERLVGAGYGSPRSIVDASQYDPRRDEFWHGDAKSRHLVTPLYPPSSELEAENARLRAERDDFKDEWQAELEKRMEVQAILRATEARLAEAMKALDHCEELLMRHQINHALHEEISDAALELIRTARRVRDGGQADV